MPECGMPAPFGHHTNRRPYDPGVSSIKAITSLYGRPWGPVNTELHAQVFAWLTLWAAR